MAKDSASAGGTPGSSSRPSPDEPPSLEQLAKRYLDAWQDQMARVVQDPATADMMSRTFSLMSQGARAFTAGGPFPPFAEACHDSNRRTTASGSPTAPAEGENPAAGATSAAAAAGDGGLQLSDVQQRLATLEERLAVVERENGQLRQLLGDALLANTSLSGAAAAGRSPGSGTTRATTGKSTGKSTGQGSRKPRRPADGSKQPAVVPAADAATSPATTPPRRRRSPGSPVSSD